MTTLELIYKDHKKWINTTKKMGCTLQEAEDIVGDMYIKVAELVKKGLVPYYGNEINYFYIYRALRNTFLNLKNKKKKMNSVSLDFTQDLEQPEMVDFDEANSIVEEKLSTMHWYDQKVFNMIQDGYTIRELSNKTNITYHSLYNTYRKVKEELKKEII